MDSYTLILVELRSARGRHAARHLATAGAALAAAAREPWRRRINAAQFSALLRALSDARASALAALPPDIDVVAINRGFRGFDHQVGIWHFALPREAAPEHYDEADWLAAEFRAALNQAARPGAGSQRRGSA